MNLSYFSPNDSVFTVRNVQVKFGEGVASEVGYEVKRMGAKKVLIVTDENISKNTDILNTIKDSLEKAGIGFDVFDSSPVEPIDTAFMKGLESIKGNTYDAFVGVGGGSSIDTAKMLNLYTTYPTQDFKDYVAPPTGLGKTIPGPLKPLIAIPTTAGTGSENTPVAIVDLEKEKLKVGISHQYLLPSLALLDPVLTVTLPSYYTASTGMDALLHSIEAYTALPYYARIRPDSPDKRPVYIGANPVSDLFVEKSIELIGKYLRRACHNPYDLEARSNMLLAAHLGGAFGNAGVHIPHSLAYPLAGRNHQLPHGISVCVTAPAALEFIIPTSASKLKKVAQLMGKNTDGLSDTEGAYLAKEAVVELMKDIDFPSGIEAVGFSEKDIEELSQSAMQVQRLLVCSPRPVKIENIREIYKKSLKNW
ncbi:hydroxyacid-oxoacid transhydrogenase [Desulfurella sp.]